MSPPESSVLQNGVTVITRQRPGSQVLAIDAAVRAGARYEGGSTASAARFLESALLLGTDRWPNRDALVRAVTGRGGNFSVSAGREVLEVQVTVGVQDATLAMDVLSDVLLRSRFDSEAVETERDVVLQQVLSREDEPSDHAYDVLSQAIYGAHPLGRLPYGTSAGVEALTVQSLRGYWAERLVGPNVLIGVVSGLPHEEVVRHLEAVLANLPAGPVPAVNYQDVPAATAQTIELELGTDQSHVYIGAPVPGLTSPDRPALQVLNGTLSRSSGRLFVEIRDRRGLAYSTYSSLPTLVDGGIFYVYAGTRPSTADEVARLLLAEIARLGNEPVSTQELQDAIEGEIGARIVGVETSASEALYLARDTLFGVPSAEVQAANLRAVTAADVQRVARQYLDPSRLTTVVTRPTSDAEAGDDE